VAVAVAVAVVAVGEAVLEVPAVVLQGQELMHHQGQVQESVLAQPQEPELVQALEAQALRLAHLLAQELARDQV
jgi:F420-0:gamma-glutamyl ligase